MVYGKVVLWVAWKEVLWAVTRVCDKVVLLVDQMDVKKDVKKGGWRGLGKVK